MKHVRSFLVLLLPLATFLASNLTSSAHQPVPFEVKVIEERHAEKIREADHRYLKALRKQKEKFMKRGDLQSADLIARMIKSYKPHEMGLSDLCQIRVSSQTKISAETLKDNVRRLSGGYRPAFSFIADQIKGKQFIRTPWRSKPKYQVEVVKSGYLYLFGVDWKSIKNTSLKPDVVTDTVRGRYVGAVYVVHVTAGQTFQCSGYEACLIADEISVQ